MAVFFIRLIFRLFKEMLTFAFLMLIVFHVYLNIRESQTDYGATSINIGVGDRKLLYDADRWYSIDEVDITYEPHLLLSVVSAVCGKRLGYDSGKYKFAVATLVIPFIRGCAITDFSTPRPTCHVIYLSTSEGTRKHEIKHCLGYAHTDADSDPNTE